MTNNSEPTPVSEFPLRMGTAKKTINDLATNHKHRIRIGKHTKNRMAERGVSIRDIFNVLSSSRSIMQEEPARQANGDYICTLLGVSAGERITVVIALKEIDVDPEAKTVTVYVE
tara:strand:- start:875 stop:1219 length:345 start_codon:yes stop_codon:yes gene_type:complete